MSDTVRPPCGCVSERHAPSGVLRSVVKCPKHSRLARAPATLDEAYYTELGVLKDGRLAATNHVAELIEALGPIPLAVPKFSWALEVGCGVSPYVAAVARAGHIYLGIDRSHWAADWMRRKYGVTVYCEDFEEADFLKAVRWSLILAAHSFEHMDDAPGAIARCGNLLVPGGELWVVVPDDSDPCNPDHIWFFTLDTLRACLETAGLVVERTAIRKYVPHENFLYARARKPV